MRRKKMNKKKGGQEEMKNARWKSVKRGCVRMSTCNQRDLAYLNMEVIAWFVMAVD